MTDRASRDEMHADITIFHVHKINSLFKKKY
jgi:hypothetical protein